MAGAIGLVVGILIGIGVYRWMLATGGPAETIGKAVLIAGPIVGVLAGWLIAGLAR